MSEDFTPDVVAAVRALYESDTSAQALFDWTARRERDASSTSIDRMCQVLGISRGKAVRVARSLQEANCGEFILGRRGQKSRFSWYYSCISLGHAASGESSDLEEPENPISDDEEDICNSEMSMNSLSGFPTELSLHQAKDILARSLGVSPSSIEITVKA